MLYFHSYFINFIKYTNFGCDNYANDVYRFCKNIISLLLMIYPSSKQIKPTHSRIFKEIIFNIYHLYPNTNFSEVSNQGFERNMKYVSNLKLKHLNDLDDEDTPSKILGLFHYVAFNKVVVDNIVQEAKTEKQQQLVETLIIEEHSRIGC